MNSSRCRQILNWVNLLTMDCRWRFLPFLSSLAHRFSPILSFLFLMLFLAWSCWILSKALLHFLSHLLRILHHHLRLIGFHRGLLHSLHLWLAQYFALLFGYRYRYFHLLFGRELRHLLPHPQMTTCIQGLWTSVFKKELPDLLIKSRLSSIF